MNISKDTWNYICWKRDNYKESILRPLINNLDIPRFLYFKVGYDVLNEVIQEIEKEENKK